MNTIHEAYELGQSFWLDYIRRDLLGNGDLSQLIEAGEIRGVTSNPTIFQKAIGESDLYNAAIRPMAHAGWSAARIFETLAIEDIRSATDLFLPVYEGTGGRDGFVSIEVNPELADETEATIEEARRLWQAVGRPNLMVKIPATANGIPAIEQALFEGLNINITLIFSLERYSEVMEAYVRALERRLEGGQELDRIASVASFFVSRVDSAADGRLDGIIRDEGSNAERALALQGSAATANAKLAYAQFKAVFESSRFERLSDGGARVQRPLWASTSTKNPSYSDVLYVDGLIGPHTVNTLPPSTLDAYRDHGKAELTLEQGLSDSRAQLEAMEAMGVSLAEITEELEISGVQSFAESFRSLLQTVAERADSMRREIGPLATELEQKLPQMDADRVSARFSSVDLSLWDSGKKDSRLKERLAWMDLDLDASQARGLADKVGAERIAWIGGGESLSVLSEATESDREVVVLKTLDPAELRSFSKRTPIDSTFFTAVGRGAREVQTRMQIKAIWQRAQNRLGERAGEQFVALAQPDSQLSRWAREVAVEQILDPRPGPLSSEQLVQAALFGADPQELLDGAAAMKASNSPGVEAARNPGLYLGAALATCIQLGRNPIYLLAEPRLAARAEWIVDLVESRTQLSLQAGLPESAELEEAVIVYVRSGGDLDDRVNEWVADEVPVVVLEAQTGLRGVGADAVRWELASGVAAHLLGDVAYPAGPYEAASERLFAMLERHEKKGEWGFPSPQWSSDTASVWWSGKGRQLAKESGLKDLATAFVERMEQRGRLRLGMYQRDARSSQALVDGLRARLAEMLELETDIAYGRMPRRFLLNGFSMLVGVDPDQDESVPGTDTTYGAVQKATLLADFENLKQMGAASGAIYFKSSEALGDWFHALEAASDLRMKKAREAGSEPRDATRDLASDRVGQR